MYNRYDVFRIPYTDVIGFIVMFYPRVMLLYMACAGGMSKNKGDNYETRHFYRENDVLPVGGGIGI